jgi:hypothetical protein
VPETTARRAGKQHPIRRGKRLRDAGTCLYCVNTSFRRVRVPGMQWVGEKQAQWGIHHIQEVGSWGEHLVQGRRLPPHLRSEADRCTLMP